MAEPDQIYFSVKSGNSPSVPKHLLSEHMEMRSHMAVEQSSGSCEDIWEGGGECWRGVHAVMHNRPTLTTVAFYKALSTANDQASS